MKKRGRLLDSEAISSFSKMVASGTKFILPPGGDVGVKNVNVDAQLQFVKCPYPVSVFEYVANPPENLAVNATNSVNRLCVVMTKQAMIEAARGANTLYETYLNMKLSDVDDGEDGVFVSVNYLDDKVKEWSPPLCLLYVAKSQYSEICAQDNVKVKILSMPLMVETIADIGERMPHLNVVDMYVKESIEDIAIALKAMLCLNAKNIKQVSIPASVKLNAKRSKHGKTPFFEYKVLDIFLNAEGMMPTRENLKQCMESGTSMRLHSRRGHFKTRKTGIFWWSNHMAGRRDKGTIVKDYNVV
jgi:hypothetical protein